MALGFRMKMSTRLQIAQGFAAIGTVGLLFTAFVVPSQWLSGQLRVEAQIGTFFSFLCVLLAAAAARSVPFGLKVFLSALLLVSLGYLAVVPFVVAEVGWNSRAAALVGALVVVVMAASLGLWRLREAAQQAHARDVRNARA
jgi:hypothetical protein